MIFLVCFVAVAQVGNWIKTGEIWGSEATCMKGKVVMVYFFVCGYSVTNIFCDQCSFIIAVMSDITIVVSFLFIYFLLLFSV